MGASRALFGLVFAVMLALSVYALGHLFARHRVPSGVTAPPQGFAGWLLVLAAGQWLAMLLVVAALLRGMPQTADTSVPAQLRLLAHLLLLAFTAATTILMMRKSGLYPRLLRVELVLLVVLPPIQAIWFAEENGSYVTEPKLWIAFAVRLAATSMLAAGLFLYSQHSLRMRATFVH